MRKLLAVAGAGTLTLGLSLGLGACAAGTGTGVSAQHSITTSQAPSHKPAAAHKAAVSVMSTKTKVVFKVTGTGTPSITYGSDSDSVNAPGGLGILGDGVALPFHASMPFHSSAMYYSVTAQLETAGSIHATVTKVIVTRYSDGSRKVVRTLLAQGSAAGNAAIADPQWNAGF